MNVDEIKSVLGNVSDSEFAKALAVADNTVRNETGYGLSAHVVWAGVSYWNFHKARRHAKKGNYPAAIFYALVWLGLNSNTNAAIASKQRAKQAPKKVDFTLEDFLK